MSISYCYVNLQKRKRMTNLIAKPIIKNQYWVVTDGEKKVGNVVANGSGFDLIIEGKNTHFKTTNEIKKKVKIEFQTLKSNNTQAQLPFAIFPTSGKIYNSFFDVKRKLHIFTKSAKSKCYHAAGYFILNQTGQEEVIFCPKYIFIQRYKYEGPFKTKEEALERINKT